MVTLFAALVTSTMVFVNVRLAGETVMFCAHRGKLAIIRASTVNRMQETRSEINLFAATAAARMWTPQTGTLCYCRNLKGENYLEPTTLRGVLAFVRADKHWGNDLC